jgi:signal transduction histidine kinase
MGGLEEDRARHAIEVIERNARTQAQVIDDLLDVSPHHHGKLHLEVRPLMPASSIESALDSVRPMAEAKGVTLHAARREGGAHLRRCRTSPADRLESSLQRDQVHPARRRRHSEPGDRRPHVEIHVTDNGEGISSEFLPYVFDRFRQADASAARFRGGLGLGSPSSATS